MDLEETKKIIENKIEAGELTREVRSQIKSCIDQKQNLREVFTETFKPLIESQEAVKASIDKEQNAIIEQLQKNEKALTEGLNKNRLAITSGFDKMDEVKRWDLQQLPFQAIEEPEKEPEKDKTEEKNYDLYENENTKFKISNKDLYFITGLEKYNKGGWEEITRKDLNDLEDEYGFLIQDKYEIVFIGVPEFKILAVNKFEEEKQEQDPSKRIITFNDSDLASGLNTSGTIKFLKENDLPLPSLIKNESYKTIKSHQKKLIITQ